METAVNGTAPNRKTDGHQRFEPASIVVWSAPNVIAVPRNSLLQSGDAWTVFIVRAGRVERRIVRVGHLAGSAAEVLAGLGVGDEVVLFPSDRVVPGVRVAKRYD